MAIRHHSTNLCDYLSQTVDGKFILAGIFGNLFCADLPLIRPVGVLVEFAGEPGDPFRIALEGPPDSEHPLVLAEGKLEHPTLLHPLQQWSATIGGMIGMRFPMEGIYRVILSSGDSLVHEYPFAVLVHRPEETPTVA